MRTHAEAAAAAPAEQATKKPAPPARRTTVAAAVGFGAEALRGETKVVVLNGNGRNGAAADGAARLQSFGYVIAGTGNAKRQDYAATRRHVPPGLRAEGLRLARDLG